MVKEKFSLFSNREILLLDDTAYNVQLANTEGFKYVVVFTHVGLLIAPFLYMYVSFLS